MSDEDQGGDERADDAVDPLRDALDPDGGIDHGERGDENVDVRGGESVDEGDPDDPVEDFIDEVTERTDAADEDPFERIGTGPVPEGDPFERIDEDADATAADPPDVGTPGTDHGATGPGPGAAGAGDAGEDVAGTADVETGDPFTGFDAAEGDPFGAGQTAFERVDVGDTDGVWERMDHEEADDVTVEEVPGRRYVEVSKHSYCERCEYFSEPPNVGCSHEGTQILEFTDMETVRLVDCPVVAERTALEDEG